MVVIEVSISELLFFMLGFLTCAGLIIVMAILYVVFPHVMEAKRFFNFYLKVKEKEKQKGKSKWD